MVRTLIEQLIKLSESSIDFPQKELCPTIWVKKGNSYEIIPEVKEIIFKTLSKYNIINILDIAEAIHITGSIGTTQYLPDTDIDVHVVADADKLENSERLQKDIFKYYREEENVVYIEKHPIEVYLQLNPGQELLSEAVYDLNKDIWIIGPKITGQDYNPFEDFSDILKDVQNLAGEADKGFGNLKRDVIDYDTLVKAIKGLDSEYQKKLVENLKSKLIEIEDDIEHLMKLKGNWIRMRRESSKPVDEKQALKDVKTAEKWKDANAKFKFLSRYKYIKTISKLEQMLQDDHISSDEMNTIRQILGVEHE